MSPIVICWLTFDFREDIGGPSGFAPVSGICDPSRSCVLIKEEGLSSAFIIAHELGHVLGLSHDGDRGSGNDCDVEAIEGSVMAPKVGATFSYFHWSSCSAGEYHFHSSTWSCLQDTPLSKNAQFISNRIEFAYSLDEQCRMEFGEGFKFCSSFQLNDPCTHLWCATETRPDVCKTKRGSPMDGTKCGDDMWCINGLCESISSTRMISKDGIRCVHKSYNWKSITLISCNPYFDQTQPPQWELGLMGTLGAMFTKLWNRSFIQVQVLRQPTTGLWRNTLLGREGGSIHVLWYHATSALIRIVHVLWKEFKLCNIDSCPGKTNDFRAEQCSNLFDIVSQVLKDQVHCDTTFISCFIVDHRQKSIWRRLDTSWIWLWSGSAMSSQLFWSSKWRGLSNRRECHWRYSVFLRPSYQHLCSRQMCSCWMW